MLKYGTREKKGYSKTGKATEKYKTNNFKIQYRESKGYYSKTAALQDITVDTTLFLD